MLGRMGRRGHDVSAAWRLNSAAVAVARHEWELQDDISGNVCEVDEGDLVVGADASIYYKQDLRCKLAAKGMRIGGPTASHLILAAYRAWGDRCVEHLEGDYAFILYDRRYRSVFCARDFGGKRPLHYADLGHTLVLGSTAAAVLAHPDCPDDFNLLHLAEAAGALWQSSQETAYQAVSLIPAGWSLTWNAGHGAHVQQHWYPPENSTAKGPPFEEAALELRGLLRRAVDERLSTSGVTSVWMSGGWDSTAVFAAGQLALQDRRNSQQLHPVSVSYPPGDRGREDELIAAAAGHWDVPVHWVDIRNIPLVDDPGACAVHRDEPNAHAYENFSRALARGSRAIGAHVAFDGNGGDQLFQISATYLADLLRTGRWIGLAEEWRALRFTGFKTFFRVAVQPNLPSLLLDAATAFRGGRRLHGTYERWMPSWTNRRTSPRRSTSASRATCRPGGGEAARPTSNRCTWGCRFSRMFGIGAGIALEESVEVRSPPSSTDGLSTSRRAARVRNAVQPGKRSSCSAAPCAGSSLAHPRAAPISDRCDEWVLRPSNAPTLSGPVSIRR